MRDFRFTGNIDGDNIDIIFRTDAISQTDENFNVTQIQAGASFSPNDINDPIYQKHFGDIKCQNTTLGTLKQRAIDLGLDLTSANANGGDKIYVVDDASVSNSGDFS